MGLLEIILISVGLGMDAFAVAICKGMAMRKMSWKKALIIAIYFGIFQALMPLIGYKLGLRFEKAIQSIDHWIAFTLLRCNWNKYVARSPKKRQRKHR